jgi:hypothetical protein
MGTEVSLDFLPYLMDIKRPPFLLGDFKEE